MTILSRYFARLAQLPPAETHKVGVESDIVITMPDGVKLYADRYYPRINETRPTVLVRSPYGRKFPFGLLFGRLIAERGFQVLVQSCRGTADSEGDFNPFHQERDDGMATIEWLRQQSWYTGELATLGPSYLGYTQWAIASEIGDELKAMSTWITSAEFVSVQYPGDSFFLETMLFWSSMMYKERHQRPNIFQRLSRSNKKLQEAFSHLPLKDADKVATGHQISYFQDWLVHNRPGDEWWADSDHSHKVAKVAAPNYMVGGWYDVFLPQTLRDYQVLREAGHTARLFIGPWAHTDLKLMGHALHETIYWLQDHLLHKKDERNRSAIRIYVMGADEWRDLDTFPPENTEEVRWYLQDGGGLSIESPSQSEPDSYRYDPANPTPDACGAGLGGIVGPQDNREREARSDVLLFTSDTLTKDIEVIGNVSAELYLKSSLEHTDFLARLCDVNPSGKSTNISDALVRLFPGRVEKDESGIFRLKIDMWATAYRFKKGHRIRLQVSSGAFPRFARNTGSGEPLATDTQLFVADQTVFHEPAHPSALILSIQH